MKEVAEQARKESANLAGEFSLDDFSANLAGEFSLDDISFIARVNVRRWNRAARTAEHEAENADNERAFNEAAARHYFAVSMVDRWEQVKTAANAD